MFGSVCCPYLPTGFELLGPFGYLAAKLGKLNVVIF
jgi:hypothetical protein